MQIKLQQRGVLFAFQPGKLSLLGINYCLLVARTYIYISAKNEDHFYFTSYLKLPKKQARDRQTWENSGPCYSLEHFCSIIVSVYKTAFRRLCKMFR